MKCRMIRRRRLLIYTLFICLIFYFVIWHDYSGLDSVEGWPDIVSRKVSDYVDELMEPHIIGEKFCTQEKLLLVIVCSRPDRFDARQAIRETWGRKHNEVSFYFLLGEVVNDQMLQYKIKAESKKFGDIIQERFLDTYNNLTLKSVHMLKLFLIHCTDNYNFLMKVDDDVFLNIPLLVELVNGLFVDDVLLGRKRKGAKPYRNPRNKWFVTDNRYMPYSWYPNATYPDFLCGSAYIMSASVVEKLYHCALEVPLLHTEDVYLTGICAEQMNIKLEDHPRFTCNRLRGHICLYKYGYTLHYYTAEDIRTAYEILENDYCKTDDIRTAYEILGNDYCKDVENFSAFKERYKVAKGITSLIAQKPLQKQTLQTEEAVM